MGLKELPVLPEDYPLFDWADWPDSRAALVQGGETRAFQRQCWNAMVDLIVNAWNQAGLEMPEGITATGMKLRESTVYAPMTAAKMNGLLKTVESAIYTMNFWRWEWDWDSREYKYKRGTRFFYRGETMLPEYFLAMAEGINLALELMRGTQPTVSINSRKSNVSSLSYAYGISYRALLGYSQLKIPGALVSRSPVLVGKGALAHRDPIKIGSLERSDVTGHRSAQGTRWLSILPGIYAEGRSRPGVQMEVPNMSLHSAVRAAGYAGALGMSERSLLVFTDLYAEAVSNLALFYEQDIGAFSQSMAAAQTGIGQESGRQPLPIRTRLYSPLDAGFGRATRIWRQSTSQIQTESVSNPICTAENTISSQTALSAQGIATRTEEQNANAEAESRLSVFGASNPAPLVSAAPAAATESETEASAHPHAPTESNNQAAVMADIGLQKFPDQRFQQRIQTQSSAKIIFLNEAAHTFHASLESAAAASCVLGTAWLPPERVRDGLWIRQSYRTKKRPDGTLDLSGSWDPVSGTAMAETATTANVETAWLPPVRHDGGLWIRQTRRTERMEDGGLNLAPYDPAPVIRSSSQTAVSGTLDSAWYPPERIADGLYIRQSQRAEQYENNDLEVG